jgi:hypothetical protein
MAKDDGDGRLLGQLRVAVLADLVLRSRDTSRPPVTAAMTVVAALDALHPDSTHGVAEVCGEPITATHLRELLRQLDSLCPGGLRPPAGGSLDLAIIDPATGGQRAVVTRVQLERLVRRGCPDHPGADCSCTVLDRPDPVDRYRPTPDQYRYVRTRDRICPHPGCHNQAGWADLHHVTPHASPGPPARRVSIHQVPPRTTIRRLSGRVRTAQSTPLARSRTRACTVRCPRHSRVAAGE